MKKSNGQSLAEYGIIITCIAIAGLAGLMFLGQGLQEQLTALSGGSSSAGQSPKTLDTPPSSTPIDAVSVQIPKISGQGVTLTTSQGTSISLPSYPQDMVKSVETLGANGTSELLASNLTAMASQLLQSGEINQQQYDALVALANQGHRIAAIEKAVEDASRSQTLTVDSTITVINRQYTMEEVNSILGFNTGTGDPSAVTDPLADSRAQGETRIFKDLYNSALKSSAMTDPAVQAIVSDLTAQVASLSDITACTLSNVIYGTLPSNALSDRIVSYTTDIHSSGICAASGGSDSGIQCTGN